MNYPKSFRAAVRNLAASTDARRIMLVAVALAPATGAHLLTAQTPAAASAASAPVSAPATSEASGTGSITGRVINGENGKYLSKATVTIKGTNRQVLTDEYGNYTLLSVPVGEVTLEVGFTGQETLAAAVNVVANDVAVQDFSFGRRRVEDGAILLDEFQVQTDKIKNAREMAINEERYSVNIKNVVSTDQFGNIPNGNVGELVKFMPGVQVDYGSPDGSGGGYAESDANAVSVRGFGPEDTAVLIDGLPVASTVPGSLTRQTGLDQLSVNNADRVELIKVATPDMPANSQGGQINLVTKSAFDYARPTYTAKVFVNFNSLNTDLGKTVGPTNKDTAKTTPGLEFTVTHPFSSKFGVSFTGFSSREFSQTYRGEPIWNNNFASNYVNGAFVSLSTGASSFSNPVMTRYQVTDSSRITDKVSGNFKIDWKPTPNQSLRANVQYSTFNAVEGTRRLDFRPTISATGTDWDGSKVIGAAANSTVAMTVTTRDRIGDTLSGQAQYNISFGGWRVDVAGSISKSISEYVDADNGHYSEVAFNLNPGRVSLVDIDNGLVGGALTYARTTQLPLDYTDFTKWAFDGTTAKSGQAKNETIKTLGKIDIDRDLSFIPFLGSNSLSFKTGFRRDEEEINKSGLGTNYREILRPGASYSVADIIDTAYVGRSPGFGLAAQQWGSTYKLYEINQARNIFWVPDFDESTNTRVQNYISYMNQLKSVTETKDAWYAQMSGRFFKNKLNVLGGLRQEKTSRVGYGPFQDSKWDYIKRADGSLYTDAANPNGVQYSIGNGSILKGANGTYTLVTGTSNRPLYAGTAFGASSLSATQIAAGNTLRANLAAAGISYPSIPYGAIASDIEAAKLQRYSRSFNASQQGDPSFSLNAQYKLTKKIDLKAAFSRSFGLPKLEDAQFGVLSGSNNFVINDYAANEVLNNNGFEGQIDVANPNQKPSISTNWDFEVAYFTDTGGKLSVAYFFKDVTNKPINLTTVYGTPEFDEVVSGLGLDPNQYVNWRLVTATTSEAVQKTQGIEVEVRQDFSFLGGIGKNFQCFVSYAQNFLGDPPVAQPIVINRPDGTTTTITNSAQAIVVRSDKSGGAGLQYSGRRFSAQIRGTYKNERQDRLLSTTIVNNNPVRVIAPAETRIDVNLGYQISKRYSAFASARDVFNASKEFELRDDLGLIPAYAKRQNYREFGTVWTVGLNANF